MRVPGPNSPGAGDGVDGTDPEVERAAELLRAAGRVVVLTGAGISTESGIPDFRGPSGVWTRDPEAEKLSTIEYYLSDPSVRERAWRRRLDNPALRAEPNDGHHALVDLERSGRLDLLVTQNVDGLHAAAGTAAELLVEVHGSNRGARCMTCEWTGPMGDVLERVRAGEADPPCTVCGGILKSTTVLFGESLDAADLDRAFDRSERCDLLMCVGTSLQVYPVAHMVPHALRGGARLVVVNAEETGYDDEADVVVRGPIGTVLPRIVATL